jgi:2-polyprenyl-3-methyl-5-hydroxy-6-metoxy-1,4-benzoquinol methylase
LHCDTRLESSKPATFRDPQGRLFQDGNRILREIYPQHASQVLSWIQSPLAQRWMQQHRLAPTEILRNEPGQPLLLEHERLFFPSYPWEWTPVQWLSAGSLTLDLCEEALDCGLILKDATPLNILFSGSQPVFVDVLSFDERDPTSPLWLAHAQFARTFLLPLAAHAFLGWPLSATVQRRDGYEPMDLAPWLSFLQGWRWPLRSLISVPLLAERFIAKKNIDPQSRKRKVSQDLSQHILHSTIRKARKQLTSLTRSAHVSRWSLYTESACHYGTVDHQAKQQFVRNTLNSIRPTHVLDVGANTGVYSRIAAECGSQVVAWDTDVSATELHWQAAARDKLAIQPLVANFARPTPAVGWQNTECASLLSRAKGRFDCVLMLGILHHLLIAEQIPLPAILEQLAEISTRWAILEWIPKEDSQFAGLCRGREELYAHLDESYFRKMAEGKFLIRTAERLPNGRTLFLVERCA